jgi:hypothetical protein
MYEITPFSPELAPFFQLREGLLQEVWLRLSSVSLYWGIDGSQSPFNLKFNSGMTLQLLFSSQVGTLISLSELIHFSGLLFLVF